MNVLPVEAVVARASELCAKNGERLTEKRKQILSVLLNAGLPLSAYEVVDVINQTGVKSMPPMSVYRILDFLVSVNLVHKLSSTNKFVACSHITCEHAHEQVSEFLICRRCRKVKEIGIKKQFVNALQESVTDAGFKLMTRQLELDCICDECLKKEAESV